MHINERGVRRKGEQEKIRGEDQRKREQEKIRGKENKRRLEEKIKRNGEKDCQS